MSTFLVNCVFLLMASMGMISYLSQNYSSWLRNTAMERLFTVLISHARYLKVLYHYKVFSYGVVFFFFASTGFLLTRPSKKSKVIISILIPFLDCEDYEGEEEGENGEEQGG